MGIGSLGIGEIVVILLVVLLLFGAKRIPEIMRAVAEGLREFRKVTAETSREIKRAVAETPPEAADKTEPDAENEAIDE